MRRQINLRAYLIVVMLCLPFILSSCIQERLFHTKESNNQIQGVFFQPWENYLEEDRYNWNDIFKHLAEENINQIIIQWTQYGNTNLLQDESRGNLIDDIIVSAKRYHIKIIFGLYEDPEYFKKIQSDRTNISTYLNGLQRKSITIANQIIELYGNDSVIAGFYISQEIDNINWQSANKIEELTNYLSVLSTEINAISTPYPIYISGFYNLDTPIQQYVLMWKQILQNVPITVLMQNGVGANSIPSSVCVDYFNAFYHSLPPDQWGIIAEVFVEDKKEADKFIQANPDDIQENITEYKSQFKDIPIFLFSLTYLTRNNYQLLKAVSHR